MSTVPPLQGLLENPRYGELPPDLKIEAIRAWEKDEIERRNTSGDWDLESRANFEVETRRARQAALGIEPQSPEEILKGVIEDENDPEAEQVWDALDEVTAAEREQREINRRRIFPWKREDDDAAKLEAIEGRIVAAKSGVSDNEIEQARLGAEALQGKRDAAVVRGKLVLNPELYYDRERYVAAVNASSATPREKARALAGFYRGREETAKAAIPKLRGVGAFRSFADTYAAENPEATNGDVVEAFRKSGAGEAKIWENEILSGYAGGLLRTTATVPYLLGTLGKKLGMEEAGNAAQDSAISLFKEAADLDKVYGEQTESLGGANYWQQMARTGGQLFGDVMLMGLTGGTSTAVKTLFGGSVKKMVAAEIGKKLGVGGLAKKWSKEAAQTLFSPAGAVTFASGAGSKIYDSYERNREKLAAEGLTGPELEEQARGNAAIDGIRTGAIAATIMSLFGLKGSEGIARLTQVAGNPGVREAIKKGSMERLQSYATGVGGEVLEEALDEGINGGLDALLENPDMTFEDWEKATLFAGSAGALFGGGIEGVTQIAEAAAERVKNSPEIRARQEQVQSLRASGLNQTADALEQANAVAESDAVAAAIDEVEARAVGAVERLDEIDTELVELAKTPGTEAKIAELEAERDSLNEALMIGRDAMRNYDPVKTANIAVADVVAEGVEPEEARRRVTEVMNARYTNKPVTPQILAAQALAAPAATDTQPTNEEGILQQTEADAQTEAQASEVLTPAEPVSPVTPVKAEPTFRAIAGRSAMVDNEAGDIRIDEDGTVLLDRGPSAPPIIVSRNPDAVLSTSEFNVTLDEETEADLEQARVLRTTIGGRPTPRPIERPAPASTFVRDDGSIVTSFSGERGPVAAVTDFVSEGETEAGDLFVTVKDRETGNEFELHGDDALAVAVARRDTTRDVELSDEISELLADSPKDPEVSQEMQIEFDRVLVRLVKNKPNLLRVTTRDSATAREITTEQVDAAFDELTELNDAIENENFPINVKVRLGIVVDDAFNDIAAVRARVRQRPEAPADRGTPAPATPITGGAEETVDRASAESPETSVTDEPEASSETPAPVVDSVEKPQEKTFDLSPPEEGRTVLNIRTTTVGNSTLVYTVSDEGVDLASVRTPQKSRGSGSARTALTQLVAEADAAGLPVKLLASPLDKKTSLGRLIAFYESLGFQRTGRSNAAGDPYMARPAPVVGAVTEPAPLADDVVGTAMAATEGNPEARAELMAALTPEQRARFEGAQEPAVEATPEPEAPTTDTATDDFPVDEIPLDASPTGPLTEEAVFNKILATAKREIMADIASGEVSADVTSFGDLNDYVDANGYVNDFNREDRMVGPLGKSLGWGTQGYIDFTNRVIESLDQWLASGRPALDASPSAQVEIGFYSRLQRTIADKVPNSATPQQILATIDPARGTGVKEEEIKWSGLRVALDRLAAENGGKVPKQALLDYLAADGAVKFEEVSVGGNEAQKKALAEANTELLDLRGELLDGPFNVQQIDILSEEAEFGGSDYKDIQLKKFPDYSEQISRYHYLVGQTFALRNGGVTLLGFEPRYAQYQLPGGENYREVVLAMPTKESSLTELPAWAILKQRANSQVWDVRYGAGAPMAPGSIIASGPSAQDATQTALNVINYGTDLTTTGAAYTSSHFPDVPNYVAHMRLNDRVDADGKPGTFIEEIQSDRHQAGREKGYKGDTPTDAQVREFFGLLPEADPADYRQEMVDMNKGAVADAPFRKDWPLQLFKRALRDAVASGKDWIGWTTGETQAERFDLSKQIDSLSVRRLNDGAYALNAYDIRGRDAIQDRRVERNALADTVGKSLADVIIRDFEANDARSAELEQGMEDAVERMRQSSYEEEAGRQAYEDYKRIQDEYLALEKPSEKIYEGQDLKVGGEGMKGFYDNILPKEITKYVKQWGADVEKSEAVTEPARPDGLVRMPGDTRPTGRAATTAPIWRVTITPEMRESIANEGQPLFANPQTATSFTEDSDWQEVTNVLLDRAIAKYPKIPVTKDASIPAPARTMGLRILVNPTELARYTEGMEVADAAEMLDKLFIHEATHRHAVAEVGDNTVVEYANTMTADERIDTAFKYLHRSAYPSDEAYLKAVTDFAAVDPNLPPGERRVRLYRLGHESFRMNVEILVSGYTTEETLAFLQTNPGNLQRFLRYLGAYLRRLKQWFNARKDPAIGVEVRRLAKVIKTLTKGETVSRGPVNFDPDARGSGRQIIGLAAGPVKQNLWRLTDGRTEWITDGDPVPAGSRKVRSQMVEENPMDADYLAAVERGDMETAQRMVDEAARAAGYDSSWSLWHGTRKAGHTVFRPNFYGSSGGQNMGLGVYLTEDPVWAARFAGRLFSDPTSTTGTSKQGPWILYEDGGGVARMYGPNVSRILDLVSDPRLRNDLRGAIEQKLGADPDNPVEISNKAKSLGYQGIASFEADRVQVVVFNPSDIKSADPVTYDESGNVIPLSQRFNPASDSILETAPVGVWNKPKAGQYVPGGGLTAAHRWDRRVYKMLEAARGEYSGYMKKAEFAVKQIARLMKDLNVSETAVNAALGNTENRLTQADVDQIKAIKKRGLAAAQGVYLSARNKAKALDAAGMFADAALARQDAKAQFDLDVQTYQRAAANYEARARRAAAAKAYADRQAAMAALPKPLADEVANLRTEIDLLSDRMIAEGDLSAELKATISANKELWLHRSYQIFDDPNYVAWINEQKDPEAIRLRNKTINFLRQDLVTRKVGELMASGMSRTAATAQAQIDVTDAHVADAFDDYLMVADNGSKTLLTGATVSKEVSALMKRGVIPPEIQELWGRYDDPAVNAAKSIGAIAQHLAVHKFYQDTVALGTKEGWLVKDGPGVLKRDAQGNRLVELLPNNGMAGRYGNKPKSQYAPLAGYLGPEALRDALAQMVDDRAGHRFIQLFTQLTGYAMASKTVLSWQSGMRNFWGMVLPTMINGNATFNIFDPRYKKARVGAFAQLFARGSAQTRAYVERATALGVLGDSITDNLIRDLTGGFDSDKKVVGLLGKVTRAKFFGPLIDKTRKTALKTYDVSGKAYNMPDEFWKIVNFEGEKALLREMLPNETEEQIEVRAAEIVRNTVPTYSRAPEWVKVLRKFPVMAPFITFPAEMVRITLGQGKVGLDFIREGKATGNKKMEAAGYRRLLTSGVVAGVVGSIPVIFKVLSDVSADDEDDLRKHLAPWEKNVTILFLGRNEDDPSKINYLNLSFMNPYDIWLRPWRSFMRGMRDPNADGFGVTAEAASELVDPIAKEQILFGSLVDTLRGVTATGRKVWDKTDSDLDKAIKSMTHVYNSALEPGTVTSIEKIVKAANSEVSVSGRAYNVWQETISAGLGLKANTVDVNSTLAYAAKDFRGGRLDSISVFSRAFKSSGTQSDDDIINSYVEANDKMLRTYRELYEKTVGAVRLGVMTRQEAIQLLRSEGVPADVIGDIMNNRYRRYTPNADSLQDARRKGANLGQDRINLYRQALDRVPAVQQISEDTFF